MLPPISVPVSQRRPLVALAQLSDDDFTALMARVRDVLPATSPLELWDRLVPTTVTAEHGTIVVATVNLRSFIERQPTEPKAVADAVVQDFREKKWLTSETELARLGPRLIELLTLPVVVLTSKAFDVSNEHEHAFAQARILTDVRPLFFSNRGRLSATAAVIQHTLKIEIRQGDDVYASMTPKELRELQGAVSRAIRKEECLRGQLRNDFTFIDDEPRKDAGEEVEPT